MEKAKLNRQRLGGGMRQAGIIAAPGIYALENMIERLKDDNDKAKQLAEKLSSIEGLFINLIDVPTNIISVTIHHNEMDADKLINELRGKRIKVKKIGTKKIRMIVHYLITNEHIDYVVSRFRELLEGKG
ncbi:beta-eliminating lyase-related protein [Sporosarcina thermotolerans]|uniref:beta-eliminating lyase-related protein n=1 Tax=Sporosarcina thermotolerans TaxID=633404 RepID=UPI0024BC9D24|nr:beta-eliminating lyase-related protein [Sporosarcina thermotolerans]WHT49893.1 beta-eliminating lyase-related protein [Sporosarcina thermotolerans]